MKKLLILASCFAVIFMMSKVNFAQEDATNQAAAAEPVGIASHVPSCPQATLPFGYPPYPTVGQYPAFGVPYSYPRAPRRPAGGRFAPPPAQQYQPYPLPTPGAVPGAVAPVAGPIPPTFRNRLLPPRQGTLGVFQPPEAEVAGAPAVVYRPTPVKNFMTLMSAPRPYIGYDPYAGRQPAPAFVPSQAPSFAAAQAAPDSEAAPPFVPAPPPPFGPER